MVVLNDYIDDLLAEEDAESYLEALLPNTAEPVDYPIDVYNINDTRIGTANSKEEFISLWNSDSANKTAGTLSGWYGPFMFVLRHKESAKAPYYLGLRGLTTSHRGLGLMTVGSSFIIG